MRSTFSAALLIVTSALVPACSSLPSKQRTPSSDDSLRVIDAHIHARFTGGKERTSGIPLTAAQLEQEMRANGVVGAIAHTSADGANYQAGLKEKGIFQCFGLDATPDLKKLEAGLRAGQYSCVKVYLGYIHKYANDPVYLPVYRLAEKYDVAVVFHTGDTYDVNGKLKYADPLTIDEVAVDFRKVRFVIAHLGNPWIQSAAEVAYKNPNVWVEGSALLIGNLDELPAADVEEYVVKPVRWALGYLEDSEKLMYGTDWPLNDMTGYLNAFKKAVPREHWNAVFHDNAVKVFKLPANLGERAR